MKPTLVLLTAAVFLGATGAQAQERGIARREFVFFDNHLTVEVVADIPGQLQVVRGEAGRIEVAARVPGGIPAFALGGREGDRLRLTALGGEHADFVVIIPEDASLRVKLPDRHSHQVSSMRRNGLYTWGVRNAPATPTSQAAPPVPAGPTIAFTNVVAPRNLNVPKLNSVRLISVRLEGTRFEVGGTQWMSVRSGDPNNVEVQTGKELQDVSITVPLGTESFTLRLGGKLAMQVNRGEIRVYCDPVTEQDLGGGRRWYTFTPEMGRLTCR